MHDADDEVLQPHPEFDKNTQARLEGMFREAYLIAHPNARPADAEFEASVFVAYLASISGYSDHYRKPKEQRRRERLEAFANALNRLIDTGLAMDDASLGFAIWRGLDEMLKLDGFTDEDRLQHKSIEGQRICVDAFLLQTEHSEKLQRFAYGVRTAIKQLPPLDKALHSFEETTARAIEEYLGRRGVAFTTSDTGLAGESFLAVMQLAGSHTEQAKYWLGKAKSNPDSWQAFVERMRANYGNNEGGKNSS